MHNAVRLSDPNGIGLLTATARGKEHAEPVLTDLPSAEGGVDIWVPEGSGLSDLNWLDGLQVKCLTIHDKMCALDYLAHANVGKIVLIGSSRELSWLSDAKHIEEMTLAEPRVSQLRSIAGRLPLRSLCVSQARPRGAPLSGFSLPELHLSSYGGGLADVEVETLKIWTSNSMSTADVRAKSVEVRNPTTPNLSILSGLSGTRQLLVLSGRPIRLADLPPIPDLVSVNLWHLHSEGLFDSGWGSGQDRYLQVDECSREQLAMAAHALTEPAIISGENGNIVFADGIDVSDTFPESVVSRVKKILAFANPRSL
ncbi:MAG: hypothetical protein VX899_10075 [Myxococcota bacterium]|nr:hypothetical protein [Myxococcota bacterium]